MLPFVFLRQSPLPVMAAVAVGIGAISRIMGGQ